MDRLKVAELKVELSNRGLSTSGLKKDLLARLKEAVETEKRELADKKKAQIEANKADAEAKRAKLASQKEAEASMLPFFFAFAFSRPCPLFV